MRSAGFAKATRALLPQIRQWIQTERIDRDRLIIAGHSLGAAMATLAASVLQPGWLVAVGSPRVGDETFIASVRAANTSRIVDCCDVVTGVPPAIGGYIHLGTCTYLTRKGDVLMNPGRRTVVIDRMLGRLDYLRKYAWRLHSSVLVREFADHAPVNYARAFFGEPAQQRRR